ncbi:YfaP family protein [uncultured Fibrella sp.]|uniref:YfaP family protein n=1 Tax=uncultured Fibrella sp. TaxID=1284596 RepID=UPI0035CC1986
MKTVKQKIGSISCLCLLCLAMACSKKTEPEPQLVGQPGNPRFNLQFTNEANVDMDLHVIDPKGNEIYYGRKSTSDGGQLDVDCKCSSCGQGPNENIFWPDGKGIKGTYKYWVEYFRYCGSNDAATSDFTLRIAVNEAVKATFKGTLSNSNDKSAVQTWTLQ